MTQDLAKRIEIEKKIAKKILAALVAAGYLVRIHDGEEWAGKRTADDKEAFKQMFSTDDDLIAVYKPDEKEHFAWIQLIYGNCGFDVIHDYTTNLEDLVKPIMDYAETIQ